MARYLVPPLFAFAAVALAVQAASSSEIVTAASPTGHVFVEDNNPLQLEIIKTCDGGHGVFTCTTGDCYFDSQGRFGCCKDLSDCTPINSCIPGVADGKGPKQCERDDKGCTSCPSKGPVHCMTIRNIGMHQQQITCTDTPKRWSDTSFTYDTKSSTPTPASSSPKTITSTTSVSSTSASSSTSSESASPAPAPVLEPTTTSSSSPVQTPVSGAESDDGLTPTTKGAIAVGAVAGAGTLAMALFFLYKWIRAGRPRLRPTSSPKNGTLSTRRKATGNIAFLKRSQEKDTEALTAPTYKNPSPQSEYKWPLRPHHQDSSAPPRPARDVFNGGAYAIGHNGVVEQKPTITTQDVELSAYPPSDPHSASSQPRSPVSPLSPTTPFNPTGKPGNSSSPPYTTTPTPVSPIFPVCPAPPVHVRPCSVADLAIAVAAKEQQKERPKTTVGPYMQVPGAEQGSDGVAVDQRQKSSQLLPIAGPYLTAEQALGSGYWEAEREQLAADLAMMEEKANENDNDNEGDAENREHGMDNIESDAKDEKTEVA